MIFIIIHFCTPIVHYNKASFPLAEELNLKLLFLFETIINLFRAHSGQVYDVPHASHLGLVAPAGNERMQLKYMEGGGGIGEEGACKGEVRV